MENSKPSTSETSSLQNCFLKVFVRVRPLNDVEKLKNERNVIDIVDSKSLVIKTKTPDAPSCYQIVTKKLRDLTSKQDQTRNFTLDKVFGPEVSNRKVFEDTTKKIIATLFDGHNCTVFSYGATGAGKTYTMLGNSTDKGIMQDTIAELLVALNAMKEHHTIKIYVNYIEVYNEHVRDLLNPEKKKLHLIEGNSQITIRGVTMEEIQTEDDIFRLLVLGNGHRTQHPTDANAESSRSHAIFQVSAMMGETQATEYQLFKLTMVDLAGSERAAVSQNVAARFQETAKINQSLLAFGKVINALVKKERFVPFRESKLTYLLKDSLGGNCRTIMIANLSSADSSYEESYKTLLFAKQAQKIKTEIKKNIISSPNVMVYKRKCDEQSLQIKTLQAQSPAIDNTASGAASEEYFIWTMAKDTRIRTGFE